MKVAKQGLPFVFGCAIPGLICLGVAQLMGLTWAGWVGGLFFLAAAYCAYFFRDTKRIIPLNDRAILSPADGKVIEVVQTQENGQAVWLVRIFLSVFDPHLQRAPIAGTVKSIQYTRGKFLDARNPQAHFENERNRIEFNTRIGMISVTQIAGLIARRIVWWIKEGDQLALGQQFGLIRFGSQVDMTFPVTAQPKVKVGDRVEAGHTLIAEIA
jgi:phosphatidylserine decarboxylase